MRLEWIEDILAILRAGSLSAAADLRHVSQPAFSRRIRLIEEHVGVELLDRTSRPARLRPSVLAQRQTLYDLAARMTELLYDLRQHDRRNGNRFVIASQHSIATTLIPRLIETVASEMDVNVHVRSANRDECFELLVRRQADLMISYQMRAENEAPTESFLEHRAIGSEEMVPVFAASAMKNLERQIANGELPVIVYPSDVFFGCVMDRELLPELRNRFLLRPKAETALTLAALQLAVAGVGVAWVPLSLAAGAITAGVLGHVRSPLTKATIFMRALRLAGPREAADQRIWEIIGHMTM